jgi:hypothetical protein
VPASVLMISFMAHCPGPGRERVAGVTITVKKIVPAEASPQVPSGIPRGCDRESRICAMDQGPMSNVAVANIDLRPIVRCAKPRTVPGRGPNPSTQVASAPDHRKGNYCAPPVSHGGAGAWFGLGLRVSGLEGRVAKCRHFRVKSWMATGCGNNHGVQFWRRALER